VACKRGGDGALILSEFAGAAAEMGEAFIVNPYDEERTAETIARALALPVEQRKERMQALYNRVTRNDVFAWSERFLEALRGDGHALVGRMPGLPEPLPAAAVEDAFDRASSRLLLLDYDGTLVGYAKRPQDAVPGPELIDVLSRLAGDRANAVAVVSGRSRADLDHWFGGIPGLWLFAEHGALMRDPASHAWRLPDHGITTDWKERVATFLDHYVDRVPGSFVEEKEFSLVFHYRMADPMFAEWLANELVANLDQMLADTELRAVRGQKSVEVRMMRANKGEVLGLLTDVCPHPDFMLAAGDDRTDEDLFAKLTDTAWTIHVGKKSSRARYRLADPRELVGLLRRLADARKAEGKAN
jgi:trehalose 6-phosphate synthase/phosphatase